MKFYSANLKNYGSIRSLIKSNPRAAFHYARLVPPPRWRAIPRLLYSFRRDGVKIAARLFALNYLLQKRQGGPSGAKGRSRVSYRVERIEDSWKQSTTLYLLLRAYCSLLLPNAIPQGAISMEKRTGRDTPDTTSSL